MQLINPATGEPCGDSPSMSLNRAQVLLHKAQSRFVEWRLVSFAERAKVLKSAGALLRSRNADYAKIMAEEMGKPIAQGEQEIEKCAVSCDYYAEQAAAFLAPEPVRTEARTSYVAFQPLGVVLAVMPWNFPFWQVFRFASAALMAGNGALLRHASNVPRCAHEIELLFRDAALPTGLFSSVYLDKNDIAKLIEEPAVAAVTLTGSTAAGRAIASAAGGALKKSVLELGGSDAYLILSDADLEFAAQTAVASRLINGGQSCIAAKRFIVVRRHYQEFVRLVVEHLSRARLGDPLDRETEVGPLARSDLRDSLHRQVIDSVKLGAKLELGGVVPEKPGAWYPPTCLSGVRPSMPAFDEELFGPVAAVVEALDDDQAIQLANQSIFGLGAAVFSRDTRNAELIARDRLEAGSCFVNSYVKSDPRLPFGGIKQSGYGRELSRFGIREFVNIKTIYID